MSTYIVTGGAGFIGSHLCEALLREGHRVVNVDSFTELYDYRRKVRNVLETVGDEAPFAFRGKREDLKALTDRAASDRYRLAAIDIRDAEGWDRLFREESPDVVIHLAALPGVRASIDDPLAFEDVNMRGTMVLLETMRAHGVRKLVAASSSSVYGNNEKVPFAESDAVDHPISMYAATKKSNELMAYTYKHLFGMSIAMLRFFTVYGERQRPDLAIHKFADLIARGEPIPFYGDGSTSRDYTYVADIVSGIEGSIRLVESNDSLYEVVNLGGNRTVSLNQMVATIERALGVEAKLNRLPMQPGDVERTCADLTKAGALLGYEPKTSFEEGVAKFVSWYRRARAELE